MSALCSSRATRDTAFTDGSATTSARTDTDAQSLRHAITRLRPTTPSEAAGTGSLRFLFRVSGAYRDTAPGRKMASIRRRVRLLIHHNECRHLRCKTCDG